MPCYTSLKKALNQDCAYLSTAMVGWSSISCLEHTCISFFMPTLLWSHDMKGSGSSIDRKKNNLEEEKTGSSWELSSMNCLAVGSKRHRCKGGKSSRIATFQAAGQQIHPATVPSGVNLGFPRISSGNCTAREQARLAHVSSWRLLYHTVNFPLHQQAHPIIPVELNTRGNTKEKRKNTIKTIFFSCSPVIPT